MQVRGYIFTLYKAGFFTFCIMRNYNCVINLNKIENRYEQHRDTFTLFAP